MNTAKIIKEVGLNEFKELISKFKDNIYINSHALVVRKIIYTKNPAIH